MTLKEIIYDIRNSARAGGITDDERVSYRQVKEWINQYRALLIRRDLDKDRTITPHIVQDLNCVKLIKVDKAECCNISSKCDVLRTESKIPVPVELALKDAIIYVGSVNKTEGYEFSSPVMSHWDKFNKYTSGIPKAYFFNGYIYITNEDFLEYINIRIIASDPTQAANFNSCTGDPCYTDESDYPVSKHMVPTIKQMIFEQELKLTLSTDPDLQNNSIGVDAKSQG